MQWTVVEHDRFLWCMRDGRIVDPIRVCPHSMHTLLKKAARAWQWRCDALHEGCEGFDRGAVVAPLFAALHNPRLSAQEQANLRSVVVDGQWTQPRKYRAAKTLSPLCALCSSEERSFDPQALPLLRSARRRAKQHAGPFPRGPIWRSLEARDFFQRALLPALKERPPG